MNIPDLMADRACSVAPDLQETLEWMEALESVIANAGPERAIPLVQGLQDWAAAQGIAAHVLPYSAYRNTIPLQRQGAYTAKNRRRRSDKVSAESTIATNQWHRTVRRPR